MGENKVVVWFWFRLKEKREKREQLFGFGSNWKRIRRRESGLKDFEKIDLAQFNDFVFGMSRVKFLFNTQRLLMCQVIKNVTIRQLLEVMSATTSTVTLCYKEKLELDGSTNIRAKTIQKNDLGQM